MNTNLNNNNPKITVLTVTHKRTNALRRYLNSLICSKRFNQVSVLIMINGMDSETEKVLDKYSAQYKNITFIRSSHYKRGKARNILIQRAQGDILYFLDDDIILDRHAFEILTDYAKRCPDIGIMGGINATPPESNLFQKAQGYVLGSFFGTLWMSRRYAGLSKTSFVDECALILCNLAIRKSVFKKNGTRFPESIICAEENVLLQELVNKREKALHIPELVVFHERRKNLTSFFKQIFVYGRGRCQAIKYLGKINNICYLVPSTFLLYICSLLIYRLSFYSIPLYIYLWLCIVNALHSMLKTKDVISSFITIMLFPMVHIAYGLGFLFELFYKSQNAVFEPSIARSVDRGRL